MYLDLHKEYVRRREADGGRLPQWRKKASSGRNVGPAWSIEFRCIDPGRTEVKAPDTVLLAGESRRTEVVGRVLEWRIGSQVVTRRDDFERLVRGLLDDEGSWIESDGQWSQRPVRVVPLAGTTFGDVATTVDILLAAGVEDPEFGEAEAASRPTSHPR